MIKALSSLTAIFSFAILKASPESPFFVDAHDPAPAGKQWSLVESMSDEFDGESIDLSKWQTQPVGNGWSWIGRPPGLFKAENVAVKDGNMQVTVGVLPEPVTINGRQYLYQGAIVRSKEAGQKGWYFETRMKANATEMSSTFWLMTRHGPGNKLELDIQECVGATTPLTRGFAKNWDRIFHSNLIHRKNHLNPKSVQRQGSVSTDVPNHSRYFVYAAWWKSEDEVQFFLDGEYAYSITPSVKWDIEAYIQMAIETYHWNPVPPDGGMVKRGSLAQRQTQYDWVRVWRLEDLKTPEAP